MIRLIISIVLSLVVTLLMMPLCSDYLLKGLYESRYTNEDIRVDVSLHSSKPDSLKIISDNSVQKARWDKSGNTMVVQDSVNSKWEKYAIRAKVVKGGTLSIKLLGPDKRVNNIRYPVLVDYRALRINGTLVLDKKQTQWLNVPFPYQLVVKDNAVVNISFEARRHHFRFSDITKVYKTNLWILCGTVLLSFFISWKLVSYIAKYKKGENVSAVDIVFVCVFFGLLFTPMSNINTAEKSEQENRMLARKPSLFQNTGGGYNLQYGRGIEKWFNDRFYGRDWALKLDSKLKYSIDRIYKKGNALYISDNGWMFNDYKYPLLNQIETNEAIQQFKVLNQLCKQNNIKLYILLVPYKSAIYHEILEKEYTFKIEDIQRYARYVNQLRQKTGIPIVHPYEALRNARHDDYVFFKQAHHWTDWGAYQGYLALMKEITRDFPDMKTVLLNDYKKTTSKLIRDDWDRKYHTGHTTRLLGFDVTYAKRNLLKENYTYYEHKSGNNLLVEKMANMKRFAQNTSSGYRVFLIGNSQNENLLQFLPYSARELKYVRLNASKLPAQEQPKLLKYYKKDILDFKPDILIYSVSSEIPKQFLLNLTKK